MMSPKEFLHIYKNADRETQEIIKILKRIHDEPRFFNLNDARTLIFLMKGKGFNPNFDKLVKYFMKGHEERKIFCDLTLNMVIKKLIFKQKIVLK